MDLCSEDHVRKILKAFYNMDVISIERLEGYEDSNTRLQTRSRTHEICDVVLKLSPLTDSKVVCSVDLQTSMMHYLNQNGVNVPNVIQSASEKLYFVYRSDKGLDVCGRLQTRIPGFQLDTVTDILPVLREVGELAGEMDSVLTTFTPSQKENIDTEWGLSNASLLRKMLPNFCRDDLQLIGKEILDDFEGKLRPVMHLFQTGYIHADVIGSNILLSRDENNTRDFTSGIIDFGDACYGTYVYEIATLMADIMALYPTSAMTAGKLLLEGFCSKFNLSKVELSFLRLCICIRLLQVSILSEKAAHQNPVNRTYITRRLVPYASYCKMLWKIGEAEFRKYLNIEIV